jgi:hypothetical protein
VNGQAVNNTSSTASQSIDVSAGSPAIRQGTVCYTLSAYLGGYLDQNDNAQLSLQFLDANGNTLGQAHVGPVLGPARNYQTGLLPVSTTGSVPPQTRTIRVTLTMTRTDPTYNDGYADNLALILQDC